MGEWQHNNVVIGLGVDYNTLMSVWTRDPWLNGINDIQSVSDAYDRDGATAVDPMVDRAIAKYVRILPLCSAPETAPVAAGPAESHPNP